MARISRDQLHRHKATHTRQNSWWLLDAKGIPVSRVCDDCEETVKSEYDPAIFGEGPCSYEEVVEDRIEPEDP